MEKLNKIIDQINLAASTQEKINIDVIKEIIEEYFETKYDTDDVFYCFFYLKKLIDNFEEKDMMIFFIRLISIYRNGCTKNQLFNALKSYLTKYEMINVCGMKKGDLVLDNFCRIVEIDKLRKVKNNGIVAIGYDVRSGLKHTLALHWLIRAKIISHEFDNIADLDHRFIIREF